MLVIKAETRKMLVRIADREDLIRLLLQKQSDLGLILGGNYSVRNFRILNVLIQTMDPKLPHRCLAVFPTLREYVLLQTIKDLISINIFSNDLCLHGEEGTS